MSRSTGRAPPSAPPHGGPVPAISSSRRTCRGGDSRPSLHYHLLGATSTALYSLGGSLNSALILLYFQTAVSGPSAPTASARIQLVAGRASPSITHSRHCWTSQCWLRPRAGALTDDREPTAKSARWRASQMASARSTGRIPRGELGRLSPGCSAARSGPFEIVYTRAPDLARRRAEYPDPGSPAP
jgi:hypothetical protein